VWYPFGIPCVFLAMMTSVLKWMTR
jgi:hypothetical protein